MKNGKWSSRAGSLLCMLMVGIGVEGGMGFGASAASPPKMNDLSDAYSMGELSESRRKTKRVTLRNEGGEPLEITLSLAGDDVFSLSPGEVTLEPGTRTQFTITFFPTTGGDYTSTLTVRSNDPDKARVTIPVTGSLVEKFPKMSDLSQVDLAFGDVAISEEISWEFSLENTGEAQLSAEFSLEGDDVFSISPGSVVLNPGSIGEVTVSFSSSTPGDYAATLRVTSNDPDQETSVIQVSGSVVEPSDYTITAYPTTNTPVIDGQIGPGEYADATPIEVDFLNPTALPGFLPWEGNSPRSKEDLSFKVYAVYTQTDLCITVDVTDDILRDDSPGSAWSDDNVEIYLDGDLVSNDLTLGNSSAEGDGSRVDVGSDDGRPGFALAGEREGGRIHEFCWPLDMIDTEDGPGQVPVTPGTTIGLGVFVTDNDGESESLIKGAWVYGGNQGNPNNEGYWGRLYFDLSAPWMDELDSIEMSDLSQVDLGFGGVAISKRKSREFFLENTGEGNLNVEFSLEGDDVFSISPGSVELSPGSIRKITVFFQSPTPGDYAATLRVTSNAPGQETSAIPVTGRVLEPPWESETKITTVAGNGNRVFSGDGGLATNAGLVGPSAVHVDSWGNIYMVTGNFRIRKVDAETGIITSVAGNGSSEDSGDGDSAISIGLDYPNDVCVDGAGNIYISEQRTPRIRKVDGETGIITTVAGTEGFGPEGDGASAVVARLNLPGGVFVDDSGNIYIADAGSNKIRKIDGETGIINTVAGNGEEGFSGDGGPATSARLAGPQKLHVDDAGNIYIPDEYNQRIRKVDASTGIITTVAGSGAVGRGSGDFSGDGGPATDARLSHPKGVAVDAVGNICFGSLSMRIFAS
jgi:hypothetical protein